KEKSAFATRERQMTVEKSTVEEIRQRFDSEVEIFSTLETGQAAAIDSPLAMSLVAEAAAATTPHAQSILDVGCGAGNYTLKLLERMPNLHVTLVDLSQAMLDRAVQRVRPQTTGKLEAFQADIRELELGQRRFDIILASAVLHHLRAEAEWRSVFQKLHDALKPRGSLWIFDIVESTIPEVQAIHWRRYGEYLTQLQDETFRDEMLARITLEDTPRSVPFQLDLLRAVGFSDVEILHKNSCYAAFGAVKR
ncbi:MAG TPA: class I SAM-dependent methyltransferase, partial [Nitrospiraceae bacterium]|nr:class I SAM-dependent methyltransferase [Nitrospiraceae bacterium]